MKFHECCKECSVNDFCCFQECDEVEFCDTVIDFEKDKEFKAKEDYSDGQRCPHEVAGWEDVE